MENPYWDIIDLYELGFGDEEIAKELDVNVEIVTYDINDYISRHG